MVCDIEVVLPLTSAQRLHWHHEDQNGSHAPMRTFVQFPATTSVADIRDRLRATFAAYGTMRTRVVAGAPPRQEVASRFAFDEVAKIEEFAWDADDPTLMAHAYRISGTRLDPRTWSTRYFLFRGRDTYVAGVALHHMFCDQRASRLLAASLRGEPAPATPASPGRARSVDIGPEDVGPAVQAQERRNLEYWQEFFQAESAGHCFSGGAWWHGDNWLDITFQPAGWRQERAMALAVRVGCSYAAFLHGAVSILLANYFRQRTQVIQTVVNNRVGAGDLDVVACLAGVAYLRLSSATVVDRLRESMDGTLLALRHGRYDWVALRGWLSRRAGGADRFHLGAACNFTPTPRGPEGRDRRPDTPDDDVIGATVERTDALFEDITPSPLALLGPGVSGGQFNVLAREGLADRRPPSDICRDYLAVMGFMADNPDGRIEDAPVDPLPE